MDIWATYQTEVQVTPISGSLYRTVENQAQVATMALVHDLDEQDALEKMLDTNKPSSIQDTNGLHYLLATPFRYPPLRHGSRFGTNQQRGIFYASCTLQASLAEDAYYRLMFRYHSATLRTRKAKNDTRTIFEAYYNTNSGIRLQDFPFNQARNILRSPNSYHATQQLGQYMRDEGVVAFEYESARDINAGINVALFSPQAIASPRPTAQYDVLMQIHEEGVKYRIADKELVFHFPLTQFLFNDELPLPA